MYFPDLLNEYKELLNKMRADGITSGEMYREVQQAVKWMETGYDPTEVRASTRVDAFLMDPYDMQTFIAYINDDDMLMPEQLQTLYKKNVSRWIPYDDEQINASEFIRIYFADFNQAVEQVTESKKMILKALKGLTDNEKASFIAIRAENMPYSKVANMLGVARGTVQGYVNRALIKIKKNLNSELEYTTFKDIS